LKIQPDRARVLRRLFSISMLAVPVMGFGPGAQAETKSASFGITAMVLPSCNVSGAALGFGSLDVLSGKNVDAASTLTASCTAGSSFSIALSAGSAAGATTTSRKLTHVANGTGTLSYSVSTAAGGANWGGVGEPGVASGTGNGMPQAIPVHGRITAGQAAAAMGLYNDTLVATIDF